VSTVKDIDGFIAGEGQVTVVGPACTEQLPVVGSGEHDLPLQGLRDRRRLVMYYPTATRRSPPICSTKMWHISAGAGVFDGESADFSIR
jgi:hypothetical protein